jgi:hypothetical protein
MMDDTWKEAVRRISRGGVVDITIWIFRVFYMA